MNRKELKELKDFGFEKDELKEIYTEAQGNDNFEIGNYRFISDDRIDKIQQDELKDDLYMLGCFNAWFIADILEMDTEIIETLQKSEAFEGIGKMLLPHIDELQEKYSSMDGYGHHFNHYDGCENEFDLNGKLYHCFRTN